MKKEENPSIVHSKVGKCSSVNLLLLLSS